MLILRQAFKMCIRDRLWGRKYPHAGYGGMFRRWLHAENPNPYGSFGNGCLLYTSPNILSVVVISGIFSAIYKPENGMLNSIIGLFRNMSDPILWKGEKLVIPSIILSLIHIRCV